ncbi:MAG TPA: hypothetical protein VHX65_07740 [Pirellulales bacterium]|jgi:hypothetical protein|nr:hypothetical protein [Pirellulales bacterium]
MVRNLMSVGVWAALAFAAVVGCNKKSESGGPGAVSYAGKKPTGATGEDVFGLIMPAAGVTIRRGTATEVNFGIERGKTFDQEVLLQFTDLPKGVAFEPIEPVIKRGEQRVNIRFTADQDTPTGTTTVKISGTPYKGPRATNQFKLTIDK